MALSRITGSALWSSGTLNTGTMTNFVTTDFTFTPSVAVTSGNSYVLFLSTLGLSNGANRGQYGGIIGDVYSGGMVVASTTSFFGGLSGISWTTNAGVDLAFTANFSGSTSSSVTPELPGAMQLLPALLPVALIGARKRFKKA